MKKLVILIILALCTVYSVHAQNIIIQQNNGNQTTTTTTRPTNPTPKPSLGIGILQLVNEGYSWWCNCPNNIIVGFYIKKRGEQSYDPTNYCESLRKDMTNIPFDEGIYDIKIKYVSGDCYDCNGNRVAPYYEYIETKNVMVKKDFITKLVFSGSGIRCEIPRPM